MSASLRKREIDLARRIAAFLVDYDTYAFMDRLNAGETFGEGVERLAHDTYVMMESGVFDPILSYVEEDALDWSQRLQSEYLILKNELNELKELHAKTILKSHSKSKMEMMECN